MQNVTWIADHAGFEIGLCGHHAQAGTLCGECRDYEDEQDRLHVQAEAWDCDPDAMVTIEPIDIDLDEEDDEGDWQVLALDRFGDRMVNANW